ncbi:hypothetical protein [Fodinicola feengrottensis]|uniref:hypothetical protein n=1 Tax=Fodinicola feengrottensis TaxID=435914 RepID=UPI0013D33F53|nr:hypothetical protein [Fodinicola feengrottensis]
MNESKLPRRYVFFGEDRGMEQPGRDRVRTRYVRPGVLRLAVCWATITACLPYLVLKVLWVLGISTGAAGPAGAAELIDFRHVVGDVVTAAMELGAMTLVLGLTFRWGRRLPVLLVLVPMWIGSGLLVPIAVGIPLGLLAQATVGGPAIPAGNGLQYWVYAVVYGGFVVQAIGLLAAFPGYVRDRWPEAFSARTASLATASRCRRWLTAIGTIVAVGSAMAFVAWSVLGRAAGAPGGFDTVAQRTLLFVTGVLIFTGGLAVMALVWDRSNKRLHLPATFAWIGTGVAVTAGPTLIALSNHGTVGLPLLLVALNTTLAGLFLAGSTRRLSSAAATTLW